MINSKDIRQLRSLAELTFSILNDIEEDLPSCVNKCVEELKVAKDLVRATKKIAEDLASDEFLNALDELNKKGAGSIRAV